MSDVAGSHEFKALREALSGARAADSFTCSVVPFERLRLAMLDPDLTALDRALRLRHALRHAQLTLSETGAALSLPMPGFPGWPDADQALGSGLQVRAGRETLALRWQPDWLPGVGEQGADAVAMRAEPRPWTNRYPVADDWLRAVFGHEVYRGAGQALAVRSALHIAPEKTLLAVMPTGEGKSLVFQALAAAHPGHVVAVVVPTVALALAHEDSLQQVAVLQPEVPHAYVGDKDADNETIRSRIPSGEQGLVFAAPESFVGRLQSPLMEAARAGRLAAFVIDEAHLVNAWGADFRNEFQLLAALVAQLRTSAPVDQQPRVVCLSATVTQEAFDTLETLFAPGTSLFLVPAARLRPELDTWVAPETTSLAEREHRVLEALAHLPRPAILYVTRREDANYWFDRLKQAGYGRVRVLHGQSQTSERSEVVQSWRRGELDLVVGTSAFGLGIDYPHVRAIVHACVPESLDRYYQEVGRAGRDNHAAMAVIIPASEDRDVASAVATKRIISTAKGIQRWEAMFQHALPDATRNARFLIDPSVSPPYDPDMQGERNEDWNGRVLSLLARAHVLSFAGLRYDHEKKKTLVIVDVLNDDHRSQYLWDTSIQTSRKELWQASMRRLGDMFQLLSSTACPSARLVHLYQLHSAGSDWAVGLACGGCAACRARLPGGWFAYWPLPPMPPSSIGRMSPRLAELMVDGRCLVEFEPDGFTTKAQQRHAQETLDALWGDGLRKCIVIGTIPAPVRALLAQRPWCVASGQSGQLLSSSGLPPGPELVWLGQGSQLAAHTLGPRRPGMERCYLVPSGVADPARPERALADRFPLVPFLLFHEVLQT